MNHNTHWKRMSGVGAALLGLVLAGCGQSDTADNPTMTTNAAAPMDSMVLASGYENAAKTWGQIEMAKADLDKVVMDKKLKEVHETAFKIRDLVKTLPAQSAVLSEDKLKSLNSHVTEVVQLAGMLDEAGDANNEKSTHEHHMAMNDALDMMKGLYPADALGSNMHMPGMKKPGTGMSDSGGMADDKMGGGMGKMPMKDTNPSGKMAMPAMPDGQKPSGGKMPMPAKGGAKKPAGKMPAGGMGDMDMPMGGGGMGHM